MSKKSGNKSKKSKDVSNESTEAKKPPVITEKQPVASENNAAPSLSILRQYIKDLSFENPQAPNLSQKKEAGPNVDIRINVTGRHLQGDDYEVALHFKVEAKSGDTTAFLIELVYGTLIRVQNVAKKDLGPFLLIEAPRQIFPFARRILADVTRDGGVLPILLDPINFVALYQQNEAAKEIKVEEKKTES